MKLDSKPVACGFIHLRLPTFLCGSELEGPQILSVHKPTRTEKRKRKTMAVPKSKITKSKRNMRRAHDALTVDAYVEDKVTGELHRPHHIDLKTGIYRGKQVLKVKDRI